MTGADHASALDPLANNEERDAIQTLTEGTVQSDGNRLGTTELFTVLTHPEKRYVLTYLLRSDGEITITDLVDYVIAQATLTGTEPHFRRRLVGELTRTHLPELEADGFIEYNAERQLICPAAGLSAVEPHLKIALAQQSSRAESDDETVWDF